MKKIISFLLSLTLLLSTTIAFAATGANKVSDQGVNKSKLKIKDIYVTVPYDISEVKIERMQKDGYERVEIRDKKTGELIEAFGEKVVPLINSSNSKDSKSQFLSQYTVNLIQSTSGDYSIHYVYKERKDGPAVTRLYTILTVYSYGSFRQIESVNDTYWTAESGGTWELVNPHATTISTSGSFPTIEIETFGTATIEVRTTLSAGGEYSISYLQSIGFSISYQIGSTYYLRKSISIGYTYSVY
ncbi:MULTISPECIES: hypothetical protein [Caloramator]|uniref:Uncharacterized protein n=1 Tax=Caloramator australicus RC3 TaxID=857293 RepID=I7LGZ2_9CLOT|nr:MULTISPECIES: hypothetical protein [Caloramator]MDO6354003.1 hypothetical protein [Caloramator sp. CAR-1]CCJ33650.1 hypothetical protein CAAU_1566 [Caloramator australicus RC3]